MLLTSLQVLLKVLIGFLYSFWQRHITNRPLAGTVRRGKTPKEDIMLEEELLKDEKQCAEHVMLVDLGRNDVGKVNCFNSRLIIFYIIEIKVLHF